MPYYHKILSETSASSQIMTHTLVKGSFTMTSLSIPGYVTAKASTA